MTQPQYLILFTVEDEIEAMDKMNAHRDAHGCGDRDSRIGANTYSGYPTEFTGYCDPDDWSKLNEIS